MSKTYIRLADKSHIVEHGGGAFLLVRQHDAMHDVATWITVMEDLAPSIGENLILVNVFEDLHLVSPTVDIETVLVPNECVICS